MSFDFETFFYQTNTPACFASMEGYFTLVNPAMEKALGRPANEIYKTHFTKMMLPEDHDESFQVMAQKLAKEEGVDTLVNRYKTADERIVTLLWNTTYVKEKDQIFATAFEVTAEKCKLMAACLNQ